jgi:hypothetical protein
MRSVGDVGVILWGVADFEGGGDVGVTVGVDVGGEVEELDVNIVQMIADLTDGMALSTTAAREGNESLYM